jgi:hypothetical protein
MMNELFENKFTNELIDDGIGQYNQNMKVLVFENAVWKEIDELDGKL